MEKPIIFNTEMVKAILEGRKTQTRRVIKKPYEIHEDGNKIYITRPKQFKDEYCRFVPYNPPYQVGDILWVRETWTSCKFKKPVKAIPIDFKDTTYFYKADSIENSDGTTMKWHPSIHMPRKAARLFLKVTNVRVEKLQDITDDGVKTEGISNLINSSFSGSVYDFKILWDSIYKSWDENPWVWVIEFKKVEG